MNKKILFVGMVNSPHAAKWINLIADQGWELHFFPVFNAKPHEIMRSITVYQPLLNIEPRNVLKAIYNSMFYKVNYPNTSCPDAKLKPLIKNILPIPIISRLNNKLLGLKTKPLGESKASAQFTYGPYSLKKVINRIKPDLIHSMEFQHAGYLTLKSKELTKKAKFPRWLATNWGSDIYYYKNFSDHKKQIIRLLKNIDYYSCECRRDLELAKKMGLQGKTMPVMPNTGGFDLTNIKKMRVLQKPSERRIIMVKGYQHFAGRALTALNAIAICRDALKEYQIIIFSASHEVYDRAEELKSLYSLNIKILGLASHEEMLKLFSRARIYLGVSISDAISTSMLEAMAMGAFPIQTNTSCCEDWIKDGHSGFSIPADNINFIASKLREAIINDNLINSAAIINWQIVCERLDENILREKQIKFYNSIFDDINLAV